MFDISLGEMAVIGAVALVVIGPERLPKVARTLGLLVGRAQRFASSVKADLDREIAQSELAKIEAEMRAEGTALRNTIHQPLADAKAALLSATPEVATPTIATPAMMEPAHVATPEDMALEPQIEQPVVAATPSVASAAPHAEPAAELVPEHDERQLDLFYTPPAEQPPARERR